MNQVHSAAVRILLATDLSARCDRALDRAAQLADTWNTELFILHVADPGLLPDRVLAWAVGSMDDQALLHIAQKQIDNAMNGRSTRITLRVMRNADAAAAICEMARKITAGLVVSGVSSDEALGRFLLGTTVQRLANMLPVPLLVVRERPSGPYRRIVAATDFSAGAQHALKTALQLFPNHEPTLYHAYEIPFAGLSDNTPHERIARDIEEGECAEFLSSCGWPLHALSRPTIEQGPVSVTLAQYVRRNDIDLVVIGTHGRSGFMKALLGDTAAKLLEWLPCDVLVVPVSDAQRKVAGDSGC